jgi:hypothetical protein
MCRIPVVIIAAAVVIGGAGLTACGGTGPTSSTAASGPAQGGSVTAMATATAAGSTSASAPASTATSAAVTHPAVTRSSATSTPPERPTASASSPTHGSSGGTVSFTVPTISGDNVVSAYGSYTKIGTAQVKVSVCAKQTGTAFAVGAVAYAYNSSGASKNVGAVVLTGPGTSSCVSMTFLSYTTHLNIHSFIGGSNGKVSKTGPTLTLY